MVRALHTGPSLLFSFVWCQNSWQNEPGVNCGRLFSFSFQCRYGLMRPLHLKQLGIVKLVFLVALSCKPSRVLFVQFVAWRFDRCDITRGSVHHSVVDNQHVFPHGIFLRQIADVALGHIIELIVNLLIFTDWSRCAIAPLNVSIEALAPFFVHI